MEETLEILEGEGKLVVYVQTRAKCSCGEVAHYKHTWLLKGTRSNPASNAYRRDDCSWCEDDCSFTCRDCTKKIRPPDGYVNCSVFSAVARFSHMFLAKKESEISASLIAEAGTVSNETGLTPRQLLKQRDDLLDFAKMMVENKYEPDKLLCQIERFGVKVIAETEREV